MTDPIISVENLAYRYQSGPAGRFALEGISLQIARGGCTAIVGVTGSGKSTLVQHFNGLLRPWSGRVLLNGVDLAGADMRPVPPRSYLSVVTPKADICSANRHVRFTPESGHVQCTSRCPLSARSRLMHRSK